MSMVKVPHPHVTMIGETPFIVGHTEAPLPVLTLWRWHRRGVSTQTLFLRYPRLPRAAILDALSFGYDNEELMDAALERRREEMRRVATEAGDP